MGKISASVRKEIDTYLIENPIKRGKPGCYKEVGDRFDVDTEYIRDRYRKLREKGTVPDEKWDGFTVKQSEDTVADSSIKENVKSGEADFTFVTNKRIKTLDDLVRVCEIDLTTWDIVSYEVNKWEVGRKAKEIRLKWKKGVTSGVVDDKGTIHVEPLFQVKAKLSRRRVEKDLIMQKEVVMAELKAYSESIIPFELREDILRSNSEFNLIKKDCALEINIPDLHIGKLAWGEETGDDYDIKIAVSRYKKAMAELIGRTNVSTIERFILVVGHDFLNVDGKNNLTTAGTPQSSDSRFHRMVKTGKKLLIETIDELSAIALVDVVVVPGNHDTNAMLLMGDMLECFYHNSSVVKIFNDAAPRKYYQYGNVGIMYAHGHNEKLESLGIIFATENKKLWADTDFHRVHVGHFHHSKAIKYKDIDEQVGCTIKIISSLSSNDAWHTEKGYLSMKGAEAFLYHKEQGLLANYYYYKV